MKINYTNFQNPALDSKYDLPQLTIYSDGSMVLRFGTHDLEIDPTDQEKLSIAQQLTQAVAWKMSCKEREDV